MNREFKVGDLVYGNIDNETIFLSQVSSVELSGTNRPIVVYHDCERETFTKAGKYLHGESVPSLFHATRENYEALVMLYGEENVPPLPLSRHEIIVELLKRQKFVICLVSDINYEHALTSGKYIAITGLQENSYPYMDDYESGWQYAIAVDLNGNEITELSQ